MGMFDSIHVELKCADCGKSDSTEIQFKASVGGYYPTCATYEIGKVIPSFPPMPLYETDGYPCFECCETEEMWRSALIRIVRGTITEVIYPIPEYYEWPPLPRGRLWKRREAASKEDYERRYRAWRAKQDKDIGALGLVGQKVAATIDEAIGSEEGIKRIAFAIVSPLMHRMDYEALGDCIEKPGETENYKRGSDGKWRRRKHKRLY